MLLGRVLPGSAGELTGPRGGSLNLSKFPLRNYAYGNAPDRYFLSFPEPLASVASSNTGNANPCSRLAVIVYYVYNFGSQSLQRHPAVLHIPRDLQGPLGSITVGKK